MIRETQLVKDTYRSGEVAKLIGVTTRTMQRYAENGEIEATLPPTGKRRYTRNAVIDFLDRQNVLYRDTAEERHDIIYARVSSQDQKKHGDLDRQVLHIVENAEGLKNLLILKECGSGLNDKRPKLTQLIDLVLDDKVRNVYVTYQDRLARFGYHFIERVFSSHGTKIIILEDNRAKKSIEEELAQDMMDLVASFSGRLYGRRSHKNSKEGVSEQDD